MSGIIQDLRTFFDGYDLTTRLKAVELNCGVETQDNTTFSDLTRSNLGGLKTVTAQVEGMYDAVPYDKALFDDLGIRNKPISFAVNPAVDSVFYSFKSLIGDYSPIKNGVGEVIGFSAGGKATKGDLVRGKLMLNASGVNASGNGTAIQLGAVPSGKKLYAVLHVLKMGGVTPTLDVTVKSDNASNFPSALTEITFDQMTDIGSQWKELDGPVTDDWWRISYAVGGTGLDISLVVGLAIQ